jgi:aspartyl-tRNA(Asn)/glutamyl-tRNA(Gln) amidotransferase subunit C
MASLSRDDVEHVALLARLGLDDEEIGRLQWQMNHILDQYAKLTELDTEAIAPTAQTIEVENILREDEPRASLPASTVLDNAPETRDGRLVVPAIIGGD